MRVAPPFFGIHRGGVLSLSDRSGALEPSAAVTPTEKLDNQKPRAAAFHFVRRGTQSYDAAVPLRPRLSMMLQMNNTDIFSIGETQGRVPHRVAG
jgi:hypothetical protein